MQLRAAYPNKASSAFVVPLTVSQGTPSPPNIRAPDVCIPLIDTSREQHIHHLMANVSTAMNTLSLRATTAAAALNESQAAELRMAPTVKALQQEIDIVKAEYVQQRATLEIERATHEAFRKRAADMEKEGHKELESFLVELEKKQETVKALTADNHRLANELEMESIRSARLLQEERTKVQLLTLDNAEMMASFQSEWEQRVTVRNKELTELKVEKQRMDDAVRIEERRRHEAEEAATKLKAAIDADMKARSEREREREAEFQAAEETLAYVRRVRDRVGKLATTHAHSP